MFSGIMLTRMDGYAMLQVRGGRAVRVFCCTTFSAKGTEDFIVSQSKYGQKNVGQYFMYQIISHNVAETHQYC